MTSPPVDYTEKDIEEMFKRAGDVSSFAGAVTCLTQSLTRSEGEVDGLRKQVDDLERKRAYLKSFLAFLNVNSDEIEAGNFAVRAVQMLSVQVDKEAFRNLAPDGREDTIARLGRLFLTPPREFNDPSN